MKLWFSAAFVALGATWVGSAFPQSSGHLPLRTGFFKLVVSHDKKYPHYMKVKVEPHSATELRLHGIFRFSRLGLDVKGKITKPEGVLTGRATRSKGFPGTNCKITGKLVADVLRITVGEPYGFEYLLKYSSL